MVSTQRSPMLLLHAVHNTASSIAYMHRPDLVHMQYSPKHKIGTSPKLAARIVLHCCRETSPSCGRNADGQHSHQKGSSVRPWQSFSVSQVAVHCTSRPYSSPPLVYMALTPGLCLQIAFLSLRHLPSLDTNHLASKGLHPSTHSARNHGPYLLYNGSPSIHIVSSYLVYRPEVKSICLYINTTLYCM